MARLLGDIGWDCLLAPMQTIVDLPPHLPPPALLGGVVLTSRNAVVPIPPEWHACPTWAVGDATARRAREAGFTHVRSAAGDALALAALLGAELRPSDGSLLLVTGRGLGLPLVRLLRSQSFRVLRRVVYEARPAKVLPEAAANGLRNGTISAVMFFSAMAARHFVRLVQAASLIDASRTCDAVAISTAVHVALTPLPWKHIRVAARPNQDAMLALLK